MIYRIAADALVALHFLFVLFVIFGGLLALRWPRAAWIHLPAAAWGALIEFTGWICPLTPLENSLRRLGGEEAYGGGFIGHYITPVLYPVGLDSGKQFLLGALLVAFNLVVYGWAVVRRRRAVAERRIDD